MCNAERGTRCSMAEPPEAEPLDVVGPRSADTRYSTAERSGCDLMSHRPICSRFGQIFTAKILDMVC